VAVRSGRAAERHMWRNIRLIVGREYKNQVTKRAFRVSTVILVVLVVVVVNNAGAVAGLDEAALNSTINTDLNGTKPASPAPYAITDQPQTALSNLQNQVKNGKLDILLVLDRAADGALQLTFLDNAQRLGLSASQVRSLVAPPNLTVVNAQSTKMARSTSERNARLFLAFAGPMLMVVAMALYANTVAAGVAEEKTSRVMELLVNAATPFQLLIGKIVGIGAACLLQMGAVVAVGIGALLLQSPIQAALFNSKGNGFLQVLANISVPFYLCLLIYFLLDFFMYAALYAGLAAMGKRQDEVQSAVMVPQLLVMVGFYIVYIGVAFPDATSVKILSYVPIFTPTLMLDRLALGTVAWWEVIVSMGLMVVTVLGCIFIAGRLYRYGVLMYGQRPSLRQLVKMVRSQ
jgi:ABC-2 type transport system permease protein